MGACLWRTVIKVFWKSQKLIIFSLLKCLSKSSLKSFISNELQPQYNFVFALSLTNWLHKTVTIKLWWSEIPTSKTLEFSKNSILFVKIRSMQLGLADWKQVGFLIKYSKSNVFIKNSRFLLSTVSLKSPINIIFRIHKTF